MVAYSITNIKFFMSKLLTADTFYPFLLEEGQITTYATFSVDGQFSQDFYDKEEVENHPLLTYSYTPWELIQPTCFSLIKGRHTPLRFQFVLQLKPELAGHLLDHGDTTIKPQDLKAFVLTIRYQNGKLLLTTGTSFHTFIMDKSADRLWDSYIKEFLVKHQIPFDDLV